MKSLEMIDVAIALGSNVSSNPNSSQLMVEKALGLMGELGLKPTKTSQFYKTPAFPAGAGPDFINAAALCKTTLGAQEILGHLHDIEARLGRVRVNRWEQRSIDLDLLFYGQHVLPNESEAKAWISMPLSQQLKQVPKEMILPHPRLHERAFVLVPLADIAPNWQHPILGQTVQQMLEKLPTDEKAAISVF